MEARADEQLLFVILLSKTSKASIKLLEQKCPRDCGLHTCPPEGLIYVESRGKQKAVKEGETQAIRYGCSY